MPLALKDKAGRSGADYKYVGGITVKHRETWHGAWLLICSTITIILVEGFVRSSAPASVSMEIEEGFHLEGNWVGKWRNPNGGWFQASTILQDHKVIIDIIDRGERITCLQLEIFDEGGGKIRGQWNWDKRPFLGIYQQHDEYVVFCLNDAKDGRPLSIECLGHEILILRRVKTGR